MLHDLGVRQGLGGFWCSICLLWMDFGCICGHGLVMTGIVCISCVVTEHDDPEMVGIVCGCGAVSTHGLVKGESIWVVIGHICCLLHLYLQPCASNMYDLGS